MVVGEKAKSRANKSRIIGGVMQFTFSKSIVSASLLGGTIGGVFSAIFGWLEYPHIEGFSLIDYVLVGWFLQCVVLTMTPILVVRSVWRFWVALAMGIVLYFATRWGIEGLNGNPTVAYFYLVGSLLETGLLLGLYMSLFLKAPYSIVVRSSLSGLASGCVMSIAYAPYLYIAWNTEINADIWLSILVVWSMLLWVTTPVLLLFPALVIEQSFRAKTPPCSTESNP
jgi:hypothetical protein